MSETNCLELKEIQKKGNRITYIYETNGKWNELLNTDEGMFVEYNCNIENIPDSIAVVPLLCNILPMSWTFNLTISVDEIDKNFYECIPQVKEGYCKMHPMMPMLGNLRFKKIEENLYCPKTVGTFFSGGVDAFYTLFQHIDEKPILLTLWGSDVSLDDEIGWNKVKQHHMEVAEEYKLDFIYVRTNFRTCINLENLNRYVSQKGNREWWHDFQHGIAILGHAAPIAFLKKMGVVYIASSATTNAKNFICASDPTIDNYVKFANCKASHDGYEYTRQDKVHNICNYLDKTNRNNIALRVCWESSGGENCCECEKCYRTILEIIAEKKDPKDFGFNLTDEKREKMVKTMPKLDKVRYNHTNYYAETQQRFLNNYTESETPKDLLWFRNFKMKNEKPKYKLFMEKTFKKTKKIIKKVLRKN